MKKAGIKEYEAFSKDILQTVTAKPISLEVAQINFPREAPILQKKLAKATYRFYNAPRYFQRIVRFGFKSSYQLLES